MCAPLADTLDGCDALAAPRPSCGSKSSSLRLPPGSGQSAKSNELSSPDCLGRRAGQFTFFGVERSPLSPLFVSSSSDDGEPLTLEPDGLTSLRCLLPVPLSDLLLRERCIRNAAKATSAQHATVPPTAMPINAPVPSTLDDSVSAKSSKPAESAVFEAVTETSVDVLALAEVDATLPVLEVADAAILLLIAEGTSVADAAMEPTPDGVMLEGVSDITLVPLEVATEVDVDADTAVVLEALG